MAASKITINSRPSQLPRTIAAAEIPNNTFFYGSVRIAGGGTVMWPATHLILRTQRGLHNFENRGGFAGVDSLVVDNYHPVDVTITVTPQE